MKRLLTSRPEILLFALAILLLGIIAFYFFWSVGAMLSALNTALKIPSFSEHPITFDLGGARTLGLDVR